MGKQIPGKELQNFRINSIKFITDPRVMWEIGGFYYGKFTGGECNLTAILERKIQIRKCCRKTI
jgi:hypothetical protein